MATGGRLEVLLKLNDSFSSPFEAAMTKARASAVKTATAIEGLAEASQLAGKSVKTAADATRASAPAEREAQRAIRETEAAQKDLIRTEARLKEVEDQRRRVKAGEAGKRNELNREIRQLKDLIEEQRKYAASLQDVAEKKIRATEATKKAVAALAAEEELIEEIGRQYDAAGRRIAEAHDRAHQAVQSAMQRRAQAVAAAWRNAQNVAQGLMNFGTRATLTFTAAMSVAGKSVLDSIVLYDRAQKSLEVLLGSAVQSQREMAELRRLADLPGGSIQGNLFASQQLLASGFKPEDARRAIEEINNEVAKFGGGNEELRRMFINIRQVAGMATLTGDELREMAAIIPTVVTHLNNAFGTARTDELKTMGVTGRQAIDAIISGFEQSARASEDTIQVQIRRMENAFFDLKVAASQVFAPALTSAMKEIGPIMKTATDAFGSMNPEMKAFVVNTTVIVGLAGPVAFAIGSFTKLMLQLGSGIKFVYDGLIAMSGAIGLVIGASTAAVASGVALIVAGLALWAYKSHEVAEANKNMGKRAEEMAAFAEEASLKAANATLQHETRVKELVRQYQALEGNTKRTADESDEMRSILLRIAAVSPELISGYNAQGEAIGLISKAWESVKFRANEALEAQVRASRIQAYGEIVRPAIDRRGALADQRAEIQGQMASIRSRGVPEGLRMQIEQAAREVMTASGQQSTAARQRLEALQQRARIQQDAGSAELEGLQRRLNQLNAAYDEASKAVKSASDAFKKAESEIMGVANSKPAVNLNTGGQQERPPQQIGGQAPRMAAPDAPLGREAVIKAVLGTPRDPSIQAWCAQVASGAIQKLFNTKVPGSIKVNGVGNMNPRVNARALVEWARSQGWAEVDPKQAKPGDLVYYQGKNFGAIKYKDLGNQGMHVQMSAGGNLVYDESHRQERMMSGARVLRAPGQQRAAIESGADVASFWKAAEASENQKRLDAAIDRMVQFADATRQQLELSGAKTEADRFRIQFKGYEGLDAYNEGLAAAVEKDSRERSQSTVAAMAKLREIFTKVYEEAQQLMEERRLEREADSARRERVLADLRATRETAGMTRVQRLDYDLENRRGQIADVLDFGMFAGGTFWDYRKELGRQDDDERRDKLREQMDRFKAWFTEKIESGQKRISEARKELAEEVSGIIGDTMVARGADAGEVERQREREALLEKYKDLPEVERGFAVDKIIQARRELAMAEGDAARLEKIADRLTGVFADAFSDIVSGQKSATAAIVDGFRNMFAQIAAEWVRSQMQTIIMQLFGAFRPTASGSSALSPALDLTFRGGEDVYASTFGGAIQSLTSSSSASAAYAMSELNTASSYLMTAPSAPLSRSREESLQQGSATGGVTINVTYNISMPGGEAEWKRSAASHARELSRMVQADLSRNG